MRESYCVCFCTCHATCSCFRRSSSVTRAALGHDHRQDQPRNHHHAHEREQHEQQLVERHGREQLAALERVPDRTAHTTAIAEDLALAETQSCPEDEWQADERQGKGRKREAASDEIAYTVRASSNPKHAASSFFVAANAAASRTHQLSTSAARMISSVGVALPPGPPVAEAFHAVAGGEREPLRWPNGRAQAAQQNELDHVLPAAPNAPGSPT